MFLVIVYMLEKMFACKSIVFLRNGKMFEAKKRVCQNRHILFFYRKAPTFSSQGFVMS